jgi:Acetyltransferase (GNAT) domain
MVVNWKRFHFRAMKLDDLPLMHRWVNTPHVREWWDALPTFDAVVTKYAPRVLGKEPTHSFVVEAGSRPVGCIQSYRITDYPDYARYLGSDDCAAGVDLFVGEAEFVGHGAGSAILRKFLSHGRVCRRMAEGVPHRTGDRESSRYLFLSKSGVQLLEDSSGSRRACARVRDENHEARIRGHQQDQSFNPESEDDVTLALEIAR